MKGDKTVELGFDVKDLQLCALAYRQRVARLNPFELPNPKNWSFSDFQIFWERLENARQPEYYRDPSMPCDCGSSVCDECNPGWDQWDWRDEEPWDDGEDYPY